MKYYFLLYELNVLLFFVITYITIKIIRRFHLSVRHKIVLPIYHSLYHIKYTPLFIIYLFIEHHSTVNIVLCVFIMNTRLKNYYG